MDQQDTRKVQEFTPISEINYNQDTTQKQDFPEVIQLAREKEELIKWLIGQLYEAKKVCLELTKENNNELQTHLKNLKRIIEESWERAHSFYNNLQQSVGEFSVSHESEGQHCANSFIQDDLARQTSEVCKQTVEHPSQQEELFEMRRGSEQFRQSELFSDHNYSHYQQQQQKQNQQIMSLEEEPQSPIAQIQDHEINQRHQQLKNKYKQNIDTLRLKVITEQKNNTEKIKEMLEQIKIEIKQAKLKAFQKASDDVVDFKTKVESILMAKLSSQQRQSVENQNRSQDKIVQRQTQFQQSKQQPIYQSNQSNQEQTFNQQSSIKCLALEIKEIAQELKQELDDLRSEFNKFDIFEAINEEVENLLGPLLKEKNKQILKLQQQLQSQKQQQQHQREEKQNADLQKIKGISDKLTQEQELHKSTKRELEKLKSEFKNLELICEKQNAELEELKPFMLNKIQDQTIQSRLAQFQEQQQTTLNINQETAKSLNQMNDLNSQIQEIRKSITGDYQKQIKDLQNQLQEKQQSIQKLEEQKKNLEQKLVQNDLSGRLNETLKKLEEKEEIIRQKTLENSEKASEIEFFKNELKIVSDYIKEDNKKYKEKVQQEFDQILKSQLEGSLTLQLNTLLFVFMTLKIFKQYLVSENQDPAKIDQQIDKVNKFNLKLQKRDNQGLKESKAIEKFFKDLNNEVTEMITCTQKEHDNLIKAFQIRRKEI